MINTEQSAASINSLDNLCYACPQPEYRLYSEVEQWLIWKFYFKCKFWMLGKGKSWSNVSWVKCAVNKRTDELQKPCSCSKKTSNGPSSHGPGSSWFLQRHRMNKMFSWSQNKQKREQGRNTNGGLAVKSLEPTSCQKDIKKTKPLTLLEISISCFVCLFFLNKTLLLMLTKALIQSQYSKEFKVTLWGVWIRSLIPRISNWEHKIINK